MKLDYNKISKAMDSNLKLESEIVRNERDFRRSSSGFMNNSVIQRMKSSDSNFLREKKRFKTPVSVVREEKRPKKSFKVDLTTIMNGQRLNGDVEQLLKSASRASMLDS